MTLNTVHNFISQLLQLQMLRHGTVDEHIRDDHTQRPSRIIFVWIGCGFCEEAMVLYLFANYIKANVLLKLVDIRYAKRDILHVMCSNIGC